VCDDAYFVVGVLSEALELGSTNFHRVAGIDNNRLIIKCFEQRVEMQGFIDTIAEDKTSTIYLHVCEKIEE